MGAHSGSRLSGNNTFVPPIVNFFDYPNFSSTTGLNLVSTFQVSNNELFLTNVSGNDVGNVWRSTSLNYNRNFNLSFRMHVYGGTSTPADGFTLQWHTANNVNGTTGGGCGRVGNSSVIHALVFATYTNNRLTWFRNNSSVQSITGKNWRQDLYYWLDYNHSAQTMQIFYTTSSTKPTTPNDTLTSFIFDSNSYFIGFGAATGGAVDYHVLKSFKLDMSLV